MYYYDSLIIQKQNTTEDFEAAETIKEVLYDFVAENVPQDRLRMAECLFKGIYPDGRNSDMLTFIFLRDDTVCGRNCRLNPQYGNKEFLCQLAMRLNEALHRRGLDYPVLVNIERDNMIMNFSKMDFQRTTHPLYKAESMESSTI